MVNPFSGRERLPYAASCSSRCRTSRFCTPAGVCLEQPESNTPSFAGSHNPRRFSLGELVHDLLNGSAIETFTRPARAMPLQVHGEDVVSSATNLERGLGDDRIPRCNQAVSRFARRKPEFIVTLHFAKPSRSDETREKLVSLLLSRVGGRARDQGPFLIEYRPREFGGEVARPRHSPASCLRTSSWVWNRPEPIRWRISRQRTRNVGLRSMR